MIPPVLPIAPPSGAVFLCHTQKDTPMTEARLTSVDAVSTFVFSGQATFTLRSLKTKQRFTYQVEETEQGGRFFVRVLTGPENTADYTYLGMFFGPDFSHDKKKRVSPDAPSAKAFAWFAEKLRRGVLPPSLEVWHDGRCGACGRKLTVPASVMVGLGPECAAKRGVDLSCVGLNQDGEEVQPFGLAGERNLDRGTRPEPRGEAFQAFPPSPEYLAAKARGKAAGKAARKRG